MPVYLKQSTNSQEVALGPFVDDADGKTAETALTISNTDIKLHKAGGTSLTDKNSGGATHMANGIYYAVLDATDTDTLGSLVIFVSESGALPIRVECLVLAANIYDALIGGGDVLQVDVTQFNGTNGTFASGRPEVNTSHIAGSAVSTSSAQIGVNVVNAGGTAWGSGAITAASIAADAITAAKIADGAIDAATFAAGAINAAAIASDAITDAKVASDVTIASVTGAVGSVTGNVGGNVVGSVGSVATGGITAASIATGAIDADALAADAVAEIADGVWDEATSGHTTSGTYGKATSDILVDTAEIGAAGAGLTALASAANLSTVAGYLDTEIAAILADTNELQTDWANGGRLDLILDARASQASVDTIDGIVDSILDDTGTAGVVVASIAANAVNASALATDAVSEITDAVWAKALTELSAVPGVTATTLAALNWLFTVARNKIEQTASTSTLRKDDGTTALATSSVSDDGTTFTRGEWS